MKTIALLLCALICTPAMAGHIKESSVPTTVKNCIEEKYPAAKDIEWDFDKDEQLYEAEFKIDGLEYKIEITPDGVLYASKEDFPVSGLPAAITKYIAEHYPDSKILGANRKTSRGIVTYDVGISDKGSRGRTRHRNLYFDVQGQSVGKVD